MFLKHYNQKTAGWKNYSQIGCVIMSDKINLLQKIKILSERGIDGEKESAEKILAHLMQKYGITEEDLATEKREMQWFRYHNELQRRLLLQIIYMIMGTDDMYKTGRHKLVGTKCTPFEQLEIEANYEFYKNAMEQELDFFYIAFCRKNCLFPSKEKSIEKAPSDTITQKDLIKIQAMMEGMEHFTLRKMIHQ